MIDVSATVADGQFDATLEHFRRLGFALRMLAPADDPAVAVLEDDAVTIRLACRDAEWPGELSVPPLAAAFELSRLAYTGWGTGRAGMLYRDLLPSRQGGRFIASHIRIPDAGPVPDDVHFHNIRFQLIYCLAGWVRLVYEGQGDDFVLNAGDCVLQPPGIRHRVLDSSAGLEVVELTCPAVHETWFDPDMSLPTPRSTAPSTASSSSSIALPRPGGSRGAPPASSAANTGIGTATGGLVGAGVVRATGTAETATSAHDGELQFWFVVTGTAQLERAAGPAEPLGPGDAVAVPAGMDHRVMTGAAGCEFLEVTVPARQP